jgi:hypothetical protein
MWNRNTVANPLSRLYEKNDRANSYDYMGGIEADYKLHGFEDLRLHASANGDWANGKQNTDYADWGPSNFYYGNDGYSKESKYNLIYSAYAQYYKDFNDNHHFDIMGGYEWSHKKYWGNSYYEGRYPMSSLQTDEETGAYVVNADNAAEGSTVASVGGGINVEKGQILVVSPDLRKGAMQLQLVNVRGETVFDEKVSGHVLDTYEIPVDTYSLVASCAVNGTTGTLTTKDTTYSAATQSANGLMTAADKKKLDGIASGAQVNSVTGVKGNAESTYRTGNVNITPANIGAAAASHNHSANNITSGTFPIARGGTGATTAAGARTNLGVYQMASGTAAPTTTTCPVGCIYFRYE